MILIGDNAYVKCKYMATPIKDACLGFENDYEFHHSQCRIIIECAFGILVHRWGIFWEPSFIVYCRVVPLMTCLCKLYNFCVDNEENDPLAAKKTWDIFAIKHQNVNQKNFVWMNLFHRNLSWIVIVQCMLILERELLD